VKILDISFVSSNESAIRSSDCSEASWRLLTHGPTVSYDVVIVFCEVPVLSQHLFE